MVKLNIPKRLKSKYLKVYTDIGTRLLLEKKNYAAVLSNSIIKTPEKNSDLDIIVVTNKKYWQREHLSINGVFIELFFYPEKELLKSFLKEKDYQDMHMVSRGFVMFDKTNCLNNLKEVASSEYKKGPRLNKENILYSKYMIWDQHQDIIDIINTDKLGAIALMHKSLWRAIELYFNLRNKWFCKPKKMLSSIYNLDKEKYLLLNKFYSLNSKKISIMYKIYREIISSIIKPYDIDKPFEWKSKKYKS